jgi:hypothetical protein
MAKVASPTDTFDVVALGQSGLRQVASHPAGEYANGLLPISTTATSTTVALARSMRRNNLELGEIAAITRGVHSYRLGGYGRSAYCEGPQIERDLKEHPYHSRTPQPEYRPFVYGRDLKRFEVPVPTEWVRYGPWLAEPRSAEFFDGPRVYSRKILGERLVVAFEDGDSVADQQVYITIPRRQEVSCEYLAGVLGSRLLAFYVRTFLGEEGDAFPQIKVGQLKAVPIPLPKSPQQAKLADQVESLVRQSTRERARQHLTRTPDQAEALIRLVQDIDRRLDHLVYHLYGLTDDEIAVVESSFERE